MRSARGFTFLDSLFDILALSLVLPLAVMFYLYSMQMMDSLDSSATEFRLFAWELQQYTSGSRHAQVLRGGQQLRIHRPEAVYDVELHGAVVRKRKDQLGHEIMLTEVEQGSFAIDNGVLTIRMTFSGGASEEAEYALSPHP